MKQDLHDTKLWTAIVTPFQSSGEIHWQDLQKLLEMQASANNGVVLLGSTGEGLALSLPEKRKVVEFAVGLKLDIPLLVGVGGFDLPATKEWLQFCETQNIDGYLLVSPLYAKPGPNGQCAWFQALLDSVSKPCMLYNVPSRTGSALSPTVLEKLKGHKNLWALKEASGSLADFQAFRKANPEIALFSGEDSLMPFLASLGARGLVSVASNVWPRETAKYVEKSLAGDHGSLFPLWGEASASLFLAANPIPVKALLHELNLIECDFVRPPLCRSDFTKLPLVREQSQKIHSWWEKTEG